jgi:hypothetical protein
MPKNGSTERRERETRGGYPAGGKQVSGSPHSDWHLPSGKQRLGGASPETVTWMCPPPERPSRFGSTAPAASTCLGG